MYDLFGPQMDMPENMFGHYENWPPDSITDEEKHTLLQVEVTLATTRGEIRIRVYPDHCPVHSANFVKLVQDGYYDGLEFTSVENEKLCRIGKSDNSPAYSIPMEVNFNNIEGSVGAELDGDNPAVSSASEIYFSFTDRSCISLDGKRTVFGRVVSGREVIKAIRQGEDKVLIAKADIPWTSPAL